MADKILMVLAICMFTISIFGLVYGNYEAWTSEYDLVGDQVDCIDGDNNEIINADTICIKKYGSDTQLRARFQNSFLITFIFGIALFLSIIFFIIARIR